jgi:hypothetical protein
VHRRGSGWFPSGSEWFPSGSECSACTVRRVRSGFACVCSLLGEIVVVVVHSLHFSLTSKPTFSLSLSFSSSS